MASLAKNGLTNRLFCKRRSLFFFSSDTYENEDEEEKEKRTLSHSGIIFAFMSPLFASFFRSIYLLVVSFCLQKL